MSASPFELVGVVHLLTLPGAARPGSPLADVVERAVHDARVMVDGGLRRLIVENLGDAPFERGAVEPHVVAMMTRVLLAVRDAVGPEPGLGVNVLRNDVRSALGIAAAVGADLVRVNVHSGAAWTDQGLIQGEAAATLRYRTQLGADPRQEGPAIAIAADVHVKHASPADRQPIDVAAKDLALRGAADVVIVSGARTGGQVDLDQLQLVRRALPDHPIWIGSGTLPGTLPTLAELADGAIVGTYLHRDGRLDAPVDPARVRTMVDAARALS
ncbi:MAG: BtpA/SgcQ family protein [Alphaproteobacteria bacterium]|nr:BtpA/SgcQ family protein [Alphaproteobacteria bacterium]